MKSAQQDAYSDEMADLSGNEAFSPKSQIFNLSPTLHDGIFGEEPRLKRSSDLS